MKSWIEKIDQKYGSKSGRGHGDPALSVITITATAINSVYCTVIYLLNIAVIIYHLSGGIKYLTEVAEMGDDHNPLAALLAFFLGILVILAVLLMLLGLLIALAGAIPNIMAIVFTRYRVALPAFIFNWLGLATIIAICLGITGFTGELRESTLFMSTLIISAIINTLLLLGLTIAVVVRWSVYRRGR